MIHIVQKNIPFRRVHLYYLSLIMYIHNVSVSVNVSERECVCVCVCVREPLHIMFYKKKGKKRIILYNLK